MTFDPSSYKAAQRVFRTRLIKWWQTNRRDFQWRQTSDPYEILVAEILLRRTNAKAAQKIYVEFLNKFPTSQALANADASVIESVAKKLGLFWRAKNLSALSLFFKEGGGIPTDYQSLLSLPGVGHYVARALMVNTIEANHVPVDSNVVRVICRYIGIPPRDGLRRNVRFQTLADSFQGSVSPRVFNYALLDFSAAVCTANRPKCYVCPLASHCKSAQC